MGLEEEEEEREYWNPSYQQEPDVVPCFKCGSPMYWQANEPEGNICRQCRIEKVNKVNS